MGIARVILENGTWATIIRIARKIGDFRKRFTIPRGALRRLRIILAMIILTTTIGTTAR